MPEAGIKQYEISLAQSFVRKLPYLAAVLLVDYYDGLANTAYLQLGLNDALTRQEIEHHKALGWDREQEIWIVNTAAQAGKTLKVSIGGLGASLSAGAATTATTDATEAKQDDTITALGLLNAKWTNRASLAHGQTAVGVTEVALAAAHAVPNGFAVVIQALSANTGKIYVGLTGVLTSTGYELPAGSSIGLYVTDLATIYLISDTAAQGVSYIVESP